MHSDGTHTITIAIGADHRGFALKQWIQQSICVPLFVIDWLDCGAHTQERSNYPEISNTVVHAILNKQAEYGILLCGSGIGMAIAANRFKGIFAGLVWNEHIARAAKQDDNINVIVFPADFMQKNAIAASIQTWLTTPFKAGHYRERIEMIDG